MHWVISDIHGCFNQFMAMVEKIEKKDKEYKLIIAGDIIDRGPQTAEMLQWAMKYGNQPNGRVKVLMGNHEELILDWYNLQFREWLKEGCKNYEPIPKSGFDFYKVAEQQNWTTEEKIRPIIDFFRQLPYFEVIDTKERKTIVAHAWAPREERMKQILSGAALTYTDKSIFLWDRRLDEAYDSQEYRLIHGHTPTVNEGNKTKAKVHRHHNVINVDCGSNFPKLGGRMAALCIETDKVLYV